MEMKKISLIIIGTLFSFSINADVGNKWPSKQEVSKAPSWPIKYKGNPKLCKKPSKELFNMYQSEAGYIGEEIFEVDSYVDLNLDGKCEIIAFQRAYCGNKECSYNGFQVADNEIKDIGQISLGEFLTPHNGWLQIRSKSYTGNYYNIILVKHIKGSYRNYRTDQFEYLEKQRATKYKSTKYNK